MEEGGIFGLTGSQL